MKQISTTLDEYVYTSDDKLIEGEVDMDVNFALEDYEVARGFVLCCQSYPVTDRVTVDFDQGA